MFLSIFSPFFSSVSHFGGSCYKCKPSAIVTYSMGTWGGVRAAIPLQVMLHELGCLPVSKIASYPDPASLLTPAGEFQDPEHRMAKQLPEMLKQLEWMAVAMKNMRESEGTF